ncbi:MAG: glycerophosphodiester phosphodiesterase [Gammaproteobacteria bacterium]|nr:glycerophosphodiester phosphodiesterase [Gammaproteobacteria bacterium]MDH4314785.1 glycerophosphodiester phosphodiesterase [Gammaproteobacteria bacterium]MDH5214774.1 glycerophosphodiester phosphodiesterase [Gammaproteobacteria bacterium]MDH5501861.1 glycerophosphodiester phosphodiesterase [Gammaproteobacteria bacterium]
MPASPIVIAHRGASGYLPEHTQEAKALAYAMGADFLEQDVVASRDDQLIVSHDIHLDRVSDVASRFPDRHRDDGRFYVRDFELQELQTLNIHERLNDDGSAAAFPGRFPLHKGRFRIVTLAQEIEMIQGMNRATGRNVGIYPEIKAPAWHRAEGVDVSALLLAMLDDYGYRSAADPVFVQCFDAAEVRRLKNELDCQLPLIQLIGENSWAESDTDYDYLRSEAGLREIAATAIGIGPWIGQLYTLANIDGQPVSTGLVKLAQQLGLAVHPYTFRADAVPPGFASYAALVQWFVLELKVDGLFTDFADKTLEALQLRPLARS